MKKTRPREATLPESDELAVDIKQILWRLESVEGSVDLLVKARKEEMMTLIHEFFGNSKRRMEVYLAVDGTRTVKEIAAALNMKSPNVSIDLSKCEEEGLLEKVPSPTGGGFVWKKKRIDRLLRISESLQRKLGEIQKPKSA